MDFTLSKKHEMARTLFKEFAEKEVKPLAQDVDENEQFPVETVAKMAKAGFLGIPVPKEYGGQGCDPLTYVMCVEELSKVCGTTGVIVSAHTSLCIDPIQTFGTEEQKKKYIPDLASGKKLGAFGLTEPGAGTDAQGQQTKAVLDGDEWVLNGSKCFITNGSYADVYIVIAVTGVVEKRGRKMKEISAFIVEKGTPGFTFGTKEKKMGIRGSATYELIFEDCRIPKENLLGKQGKGFGIAMHTLDGGRIGIASQALGLAEGALERTIEYVKEKANQVINRYGKVIFTFLIFFTLLGTAQVAEAQSGLKINSLSEVTDKAKEGADTILDVAKYILAAVLGIALVFVIYSLATNNPHAKEYLLGWIIAVVVIMVAFLII